MESWIYYVWFGSVFSPALPLVTATKRKRSHYQIIVLLFVSLSFLSDLITTFVIKGNNYTFLSVYGLLEAFVLLYFYSLVLVSRKRLLLITASLYLLFYIVSFLFFEKGSFNGIARAVECLIMITLSLMLFFQFFQTEEDIFIDGNPKFWFNVAILAYFGGAFFSFVLSEEVMIKRMEPWIIHNVSNIFKNCLLAIGLWKSRN